MWTTQLIKSFGLSLAALTVASGGALGGALLTAHPVQAASPAPGMATSPWPRCATSQLSASLTNGQGTAGSIYFVLNLLNTGSSTCRLFGYPGVSYVTGRYGAQVGAAARRSPGVELQVILAPGHAAQAVLREVVPQNYPASSCRLTAVRGLRIYPPNQTAALFLAQPGPATGGAGFSKACANPADVDLFIGPVLPGPAHGGVGPSAPTAMVTVTFTLHVLGRVPANQNLGLDSAHAQAVEDLARFCTTDPRRIGPGNPRCVSGATYVRSVGVPRASTLGFTYIRYSSPPGFAPAPVQRFFGLTLRVAAPTTVRAYYNFGR